MVFILLLIPLGVFLYIFLSHPRFGKIPTGVRLSRLKQSPNYQAGQFQNLEPTPQLTNGASFGSILYEFFFKKPANLKPVSVPVEKFDFKKLSPESNVLVWFGHSSYFLQVDGKRFLIDPVFSGSASPIAGTTNAFPGTDVYTVSELPPIDHLILSHDHWDHLDYKTIMELKPGIKSIYTGLGTGSHLEHWGFSAEQIHEGDWYDSFELGSGFTLTVTPARHFSGRLFTRNQCLWSSFVLKTPTYSLFLGGDSGYGSHFKAIGERYGPFHLAILENGQYNTSWQYIHMLPEEVVVAGDDLKARYIMPVHSSKFALALHAWNEPLERVTQAAGSRALVTPKIGQMVNLDTPGKFPKWWV